MLTACLITNRANAMVLASSESNDTIQDFNQDSSDRAQTKNLSLVNERDQFLNLANADGEAILSRPA